jgi:hypothetical protein
LIRQLLAKMETQLGDATVKPSLADYIRLIGLQRELEEDEVTEIKVTWVEPEETKKPDSDSGE